MTTRYTTTKFRNLPIPRALGQPPTLASAAAVTPNQKIKPIKPKLNRFLKNHLKSSLDLSCLTSPSSSRSVKASQAWSRLIKANQAKKKIVIFLGAPQCEQRQVATNLYLPPSPASFMAAESIKFSLIAPQKRSRKSYIVDRKFTKNSKPLQVAVTGRRWLNPLPPGEIFFQAE